MSLNIKNKNDLCHCSLIEVISVEERKFCKQVSWFHSGGVLVFSVVPVRLLGIELG